MPRTRAIGCSRCAANTCPRSQASSIAADNPAIPIDCRNHDREPARLTNDPGRARCPSGVDTGERLLRRPSRPRQPRRARAEESARDIDAPQRSSAFNAGRLSLRSCRPADDFAEARRFAFEASDGSARSPRISEPARLRATTRSAARPRSRSADGFWAMQCNVPAALREDVLLRLAGARRQPAAGARTPGGSRSPSAPGQCGEAAAIDSASRGSRSDPSRGNTVTGRQNSPCSR